MDYSRQIDSILKELAALEDLIPQHERQHLKVSSASIGWHLDHSLKVINSIYKAVQKSDPASFLSRPNLVRSFVFITGYMPRGRGKAPRVVIPPEIILPQDIQAQLQEARQRMKQFPQLPARAHFAHPVFGTLNLAGSLRFLKLHTRHHLKIMRDILDNS